MTWPWADAGSGPWAGAELRAVSLFSGIGGFEVGFDRAGIQTVLQVENDPWCLSVLERHWPDVRRVHDVRQVDAAVLRGGCRAWRVLDARWFGVPQRRRRVFVVGCLGDAQRAAAVLAVCEGCGGHPPTSPEAGQDVACTLDDGARGTGVVDLPMIAGSEVDEGMARPLVARESGYRMDLESETFVVASTLSGDEVDDISPPLVGGDGPRGRSTFNGMDTVVANTLGSVVRRLTPRECERLQSFPDGWTERTADGRLVPDSHRYRMLGNAVAVVCAEWLGHRLMWVEGNT